MKAVSDFLSRFESIRGTGNFHSHGTSPFFLPDIHLEGLGELAFPLQPAQAKSLAALAEAAPYGQGEHTILDERVRKCWQIDADKISFRSPQWATFLKETARRIREDLGIEDKISLHPYKLLLYGKGGHFLPHRDTEKLGAMIGSLIISLPSGHAGGLLCIRHDGRQIEIDFGDETHRHEFQYAAFFADCEHEVKPVTSGWRCCLAYHIKLDRGRPDRLNLPITTLSENLLPSLTTLKNARAGKLTAVLLEHQYTAANLSWHTLKGNDPAKAAALAAAAREAGCIVHLALATLHQMGELEGDYHFRGRGYDYDEPQEGSMGEIHEEELEISHWRDALDQPVPLGTFAVCAEDLISRNAMDSDDPDEQEAEGFTGNAGCTMEYWYRRAAIVFWAEEDDERIRCLFDLTGASLLLVRLAEAGNQEETRPGSRFFRLGEAVINRFPEALPYSHRRSESWNENSFATTIKALSMAGAQELFELLVSRVPASAFSLCDTGVWRKLHTAFGNDACLKILEKTDKEDPESWRDMFFDLLDAVRAKAQAAPVARRVAESLASLAPRQAGNSPWNRSPEPSFPGNANEVRIILEASHLLETPASRQKALAFVKADGSQAYVRELLGPVLLENPLPSCARKTGSLTPEVLAFVRKALETETARPLSPYPDWIRPFPDPTAPRGPLIKELAVFMADPAAKTHRFSRRQDERSAIENFITAHHLDLSCATDTKGRPHTLILTKTDRSHLRKIAWREKETTLLEKLSAL